MSVELTEVVWLDQRQELTLSELAELSGLTEAELQQLIEFDALTPENNRAEATTFSGACLMTARSACRLRDEFELDTSGLALVVSLLERIRGLQAQLRAAQARLPQRRR